MYNQSKEYALGKTRLRVQIGYELLKCSFLAMGCDKMNKMYFFKYLKEHCCCYHNYTLLTEPFSHSLNFGWGCAPCYWDTVSHPCLKDVYSVQWA